MGNVPTTPQEKIKGTQKVAQSTLLQNTGQEVNGIQLNPVWNTAQVINNGFYNSALTTVVPITPVRLVPPQGNSQVWATTTVPAQLVNYTQMRGMNNRPLPRKDLPDTRLEAFTGDQ